MGVYQEITYERRLEIVFYKKMVKVIEKLQQW